MNCSIFWNWTSWFIIYCRGKSIFFIYIELLYFFKLNFLVFSIWTSWCNSFVTKKNPNFVINIVQLLRYFQTEFLGFSLVTRKIMRKICIFYRHRTSPFLNLNFLVLFVSNGKILFWTFPGRSLELRATKIFIKTIVTNSLPFESSIKNGKNNIVFTCF